MRVAGPDVTGLDGLIELLSVSSEAPIIVVTADDDESRGIAAVQAGAQDYLMKGRMDGEHLRRAVLYAIERRRGELLLTHRALHDQLTGLPDSTSFLDRLTLASAQSVRQTLSVAVLFLDLNGFRSVNDGYGHAAGDRVLKDLAERLLSSLRPGDTAARFGGDEFTMLSCGVRHATDATSLADRLIREMLFPSMVSSLKSGLTPPSPGFHCERHADAHDAHAWARLLAPARCRRLAEVRDLAREVALDGRRDDRDRATGRDRGDRADLPDVAHHRQPDDLRGGQ